MPMSPMKAALALIAVPVALAGLSGCEKATKAPFDQGVCYAVVTEERGKTIPPRFNRVADNQPQIEACAARLEEMRLRFLRMGGSNRDIIGSYQGQFIFIDRSGVSFGQTLEGIRFFALARTGDGRLAVPGTIERAPADAAPAAPAS